MSRLSYKGKFLLIASFFVVPLVLLSGRLAIAFYEGSQQALHAEDGLVYLQQVTGLIKSLETLRDLSVVNTSTKNERFTLGLGNIKADLRQQIETLKAEPLLSDHYSFLDSITAMINADQASPGHEGFDITVVFGAVNRLVDKAHLWRLKLSFEYVPVTEANQDINTILNIMNSNDVFFGSLGRARAYGTFYLQRQRFNSLGIRLIDESYGAFSQLIYDIEANSQPYNSLQKAFPVYPMDDLSQVLQNAQYLLDEKLIQPIDLVSDPVIFFQEITGLIDKLYDNNNRLFEIANNLLDHNYQATLSQQRIFYTVSSVLLVALIYLFIAFFSYFQTAIGSLVNSARKVAAGDYEDAIELDAKDELKLLANAMDEMRADLQSREQQLKEYAQTDGLTKLNTRKFFDDMLPVSIANGLRSGVSMSVVLMDIDHFKQVNDTYGHQVGDEVLRRTASLFNASFKRTCDIAARYGGEEFVALLYGQNKEDAMTHVDTLRKQIETTVVDSHDYQLTVTASFGIATLNPPNSATGDILIHLADTMLYQSKENGRNRLTHATVKPNKEQ